MERAHLYTNRAAAFLKLKNFERAENDSSGVSFHFKKPLKILILNSSTAAIELNDAEFMFKGYIRRAEARRKRGKFWEALQDTASALKLDNQSPLALKLRQECEREYRAMESDAAIDVTSSQTKKTRLEIVEIEEPTRAVAPSVPSNASDVTDQPMLSTEMKVSRLYGGHVFLL
jgi:hypothetical protein